LFLVHLVYVEGWICHHEVELAQAAVQVFVVAVPLANISRKGMDGEVHQAEMSGFVHPLLAVNGNLDAGVPLLCLDEVCTLDEDATRSRGRIEDASVVRLDDLHDQFDQRRRCEELATLLPFGKCEVAEEILVNLAEGIPLGVHCNLRKRLDQG